MAEQRSEEWYQQRLGKVTASRIADVVAKTKTGYGASRKNYMAELLVERLTGEPADSYQSPAMLWGIETEPQAIAAYEIQSGCVVQPCGFIDHQLMGACGASPDGMIGDDAVFEAKCPNTATHIDTLLTNKVPDKYRKQMQWQLACTGRNWAHFVSFDPRMPERLQLWSTIIKRDDELIEELESEAAKFLTELQVKESELRRLSNA